MTDRCPALRHVRHAVLVAAGVLCCVALRAAEWPLARLEHDLGAAVVEHAERARAGRAAEVVALPDTVEAAEADEIVEVSWRVGLRTEASRSGWALYLSGVRGHVRIALNGQPLLDTITEPLGPPMRGINRLRLVDLPPYLLRTGDNQLEITLKARGSVSLSRIALGAQQALRAERDRKALALVYGPAVVAALIGCLGLSVLLIWLRRRQEPVYGYFGVASVAWGVHTAWTVAPHELLPGIHRPVWWTTLYAFLVVMLSIFCLRFAGRVQPRVERAAQWSVALLPPVLYASVALGVHDAVDTLVRLAMVMGVFTALGVVARQAWRARDLDNALLVLAGLVAAAFGARDWWVAESGRDNLPVMLTVYAGVPFVLLLAWILIDRFVETQVSLEALNRELESRVAGQSAALVTALDHMRAARDWAERSNRGKTSFLAAASHDLRQPIHALGLYMGALRQRALEPRAREIVDRMDGSVAALESLMNSLLDISRIDAGALIPQPRAFDLGALVLRVADEFAADAAARGLRFSARIAAAAGPAVAWADPLLVERVLRNLIANAIKYTRRGGVLVTCRVRRDDEGDPRLWRVEIWDTGPGIAPEERERVFEEFYQGGNAQRDRGGGLGLGLSIVRRLAQLMRLPLTLHSRPGQGTRFVLDLPVSSVQPAEDATAFGEQPLAGLAVAVVEDDAEVRTATCRLLQGWGCDVLEGVDADQVLQHARARGLVPAAVVADLRLLDGRDGLGEIAALRAALGDALPALVVSGDTAPERVRMLQDSGLPWLSKPLPAARLRSWLAQVARPVSPMPEVSHEGADRR